MRTLLILGLPWIWLFSILIWGFNWVATRGKNSVGFWALIAAFAITVLVLFL